MKMNKLFLLDAFALIFRAYYALNKNPIINSKGLNTSAILGFTNTIIDIIEKAKPTHIAVVFDSEKPSERFEDLPAYKANRESTPEDIIKSIPYIQKLIEGLNIPVITVDGYEADDTIGTLAIKAYKEGFNVFIMSSDKDFGQLVNDRVKIYKPSHMGKPPEILGEKEVCDKFGLNNTCQVIDYLGLCGDVSDNIPGVPGIGPVSASKLLKEYNDIENIIKSSDKLGESLKNKIQTFEAQALLSKKLATIILNVPIEFDETLLKLKSPNKDILIPLFQELEFKKTAEKVFKTLYTETALIEQLQQADFDYNKYTLKELEKTDDIENLISKLRNQKKISLLINTNNENPLEAEIKSIFFSIGEKENYIIHCSNNYNDTLELILRFKPIFENKEISLIGYNLKFLVSILYWYEINVKNKLEDVQIMHYLINPDGKHDLNSLLINYLNLNISSNSLDEKFYIKYSLLLELFEKFNTILKEKELFKIYTDIEAPLIHVLSYVENTGFKVDKETLDAISEKLHNEINETQTTIWEIADFNFNISSPKQLGEVLYEKLKIVSNPKMTKTKQYSTNEETLQKLINLHPIIKLILEYRTLTKLKSTYTDSLPNLIQARTGKIHSTLNQAIAATGRLSSNNPNLQNIPIRTTQGKEIRKAFIPSSESHVLISADYSQIELRIMAHISDDANMKEAFLKNIDIHTHTATKLFRVSIEDVTSDMRRKAKTVNFGIIYGISAFGLSERLNIPRKEAMKLIDDYFLMFPDIKKYMTTTIEFAKQNGYVETLLKRRRYTADINSTNSIVRGFAERIAINAPIQGSAADMIKIAMINIFNFLNKEKLKSKLIMQVHDELIFDTHKSEIEIVKLNIERLMSNALKLHVPIVVDIGQGKNWLDAH